MVHLKNKLCFLPSLFLAVSPIPQCPLLIALFSSRNLVSFSFVALASLLSPLEKCQPFSLFSTRTAALNSCQSFPFFKQSVNPYLLSSFPFYRAERRSPSRGLSGHSMDLVARVFLSVKFNNNDDVAMRWLSIMIYVCIYKYVYYTMIFIL